MSIWESLFGSGKVQPGRRKQRIDNEILMIAPRFAKAGGVLYDEENGDWLVIPRYALPERWQKRWCKLMIVFPEGYPDTPPIGFYLNKKFQLTGGGSDSHLTGRSYHGAPNLTKAGWYWYCVRIASGQGGWKASADYRQPDNLWTFLNMVRETLTND